MSRQKLEIIYELGAMSSLECWRIVYSWMNYVPERKIEKADLYGLSVPIIDMEKKIYDSNMKNINIDAEYFVIRYASVSAWDHLAICIESKSDFVSPDWDVLVRLFLERAVFVQAWVSDSDYSFWQNAKDPLLYSAKGKSIDGLKMRPNGLPPPLDQLEVDISSNPGRRIIRKGYVEAIGYRMWISKNFLRSIGKKTDELLRFECLKFVSESEHVIYCQFSDQPFNENTDVLVQKKIRNFLYF